MLNRVPPFSCFKIYFLAPKKNDLSGAAGDYVGCYVDSADRILKGPMVSISIQQPSVCATMCKDYKYMGVQAGTWCLCGNEEKATWAD